jgi:hypothetical protein
VFGAIYTHLHNGDNIHDGKDAFAMLIELGTIAFAWALQTGENISTDQTRRRVIGVALSILVCALLAVVGGTLVRHASHGSPEGISHDERTVVTPGWLTRQGMPPLFENYKMHGRLTT